ncbi:MAG: hypothetical protein ABJL44_03720 [Algibacter sp.]
MNILREIDKVLAAFGNMRAMERTHVDTFTEGLIEDIDGDKIAESTDGQIYVSFQDLAAYEFLNISILSRNNIKTFKGGDLLFINSDNQEFVIESDTKEIESDYSNISNRWLTKVSFIITKNEKEMIVNRKFEKLYFKHKSKSLLVYQIK